MVPSISPLDRDRARAIVDRMAGSRIVVIGDVMLDHFLVGRVSRISPEAPVPVVAFDHDEHRAGGAANVALNAAGLGAHVSLLGVIGADDAATILTGLLRAAGVETTSLLTDERRPTTKKVRVVTTRNQQVARIDYEHDAEVDDAIESALIHQIDARLPRAGAAVISDYLKGVITRRVMAHVVALGQGHGIPVLVDPKIPHLEYYAGATLVTPNHFEAELATLVRIRSEDDAQRAATLFRERTRCDGVLITRGEHGMWLSYNGVDGHLRASAREVSDVTGAGDTVIATLALALAVGAEPAEAAWLANEAAGIVVGKFGPATVAAEELLARF